MGRRRGRPGRRLGGSVWRLWRRRKSGGGEGPGRRGGRILGLLRRMLFALFEGQYRVGDTVMVQRKIKHAGEELKTPESVARAEAEEHSPVGRLGDPIDPAPVDASNI